MMAIVDAYGRPMHRKADLCVPKLIVQVISRCQPRSPFPPTLYGPDNKPLYMPVCGVGDTVHVRLPQRFTALR